MNKFFDRPGWRPGNLPHRFNMVTCSISTEYLTGYKNRGLVVIHDDGRIF
jgi:hypothetical protein